VDNVSLTDEQIETYADSWAPAGRPIDWDDYLYLMEVHFNIDLPEDLTDPVIRNIKRITRRVQAEKL